MTDTIGSHALTVRANITYRQLDHWTRTGLLEPIPRGPFERMGFPREYPTTEVPVAKLIGQLTKAGVLASAAAPLARQLTEQGHADLGPFTLHHNHQEVEPA